VKKIRLLLFIAVVTTLAQSSYASEIQTKLQSVFGDKPIVINDYDEQLKEVLVDTKVYFTTHDGRYLFTGPILDTDRRTDIVTAKEDQLRQAYLGSLAQDQFINYPSSTPSKYQITVFTDIDCPYCRKFHNHMGSLNQLGISVNYVMVPRAGIGSESYKKTVAALCADNPAVSITSAMQHDNPPPISCEPNLMSKHMQIARDLKINSTPTIVLPSGQLKPGLQSPDQLIALLEGSQLEGSQ
jgi:thiol:disulfide interchange protein DsbC